MSRDQQPSLDARRRLPSVEALTRAVQAMPSATSVPRTVVVLAAKAVLAETRAHMIHDNLSSDLATLVAHVVERLQAQADPIPRPVLNATGVVINTNLGRAPLSAATLAAMQAVGGGYVALEYDLAEGARGSRNALAREALRAVTGAEDALVVNNAAAALLLILAALLPPERREVIISRGQLIEIGGGFRIPEVLRQGGAQLVEVGTTNRTRLADYATAITSATGMILAVHPSNFRVVGFTETTPLAQLAALAHERQIPLVEDQGSGCLLDLTQLGLPAEPTPQQSLAAGVDVICFSGDKLLGGPQAGIILGNSARVQQMAHHPLLRALRVDKVTLAGLIATLGHYQRGEAVAQIPIWRMLALPAATLQARATTCVAKLIAQGVVAQVQSGASAVGGGSLPGATLPTWHVALAARDYGDLAALAQRLRLGQPPVIARVYRDHLLLDLRTVPPECDDDLTAAVCRAVQFA